MAELINHLWNLSEAKDWIEVGDICEESIRPT